METGVLAIAELRYVILAVFVLGAPLLVFALSSMFRGRRYVAQRWKHVLVYYALLAGVEVAAKFGTVALPAMILVACAPMLAVFLLLPPDSPGPAKQVGFDVVTRSEEGGQKKV